MLVVSSGREKIGAGILGLGLVLIAAGWLAAFSTAGAVLITAGLATLGSSALVAFSWRALLRAVAAAVFGLFLLGPLLAALFWLAGA